MIRVVLNCHVCHGTAGIGVDVMDAAHNLVESGGRLFGGILVTCARCARSTR